MLQLVRLKNNGDVYNLMDLREEAKRIEDLENYVILKKRPEEIIDISLLEKALSLLEKASEITGREYVFKRFQQKGLPGVIDLLPKDYNINSQVCWVIGTYDKSYFQKRIKELRGESYQ